MGGEVSAQGDLYSYGILLLEMFTGRRPTAEAFKDNFNLHNFVKLSLPDKVLEIVDQTTLHKELAGESSTMVNYCSDLRSERAKCLISGFQIGVACSVEFPPDRMNIGQVLKELLSIREKFLGAGVHGEQIDSIDNSGGGFTKHCPPLLKAYYNIQGDIRISRVNHNASRTTVLHYSRPSIIHGDIRISRVNYNASRSTVLHYSRPSITFTEIFVSPESTIMPRSLLLFLSLLAVISR
ncbi:hypothetical protein F0562_022077 [Nyssa sinensis]|uniref:Protein kinase domain-containing protein n=1 Tax=Nyssa sinensis TaxID=561372 RepID=A0A5J5BM87_9ASTE|nr:hypothetical protein F0562_022077 [Nyssa sinensis]